MNVDARLKRIEERIGLGSHQWPNVLAFLERTQGREFHELTPAETAEFDRMMALDPQLSALFESIAEAEALA